MHSSDEADNLTITTFVTISAPPADVWAVLADFSRYGHWHPTLEILAGEAKQGCAISMRIAAGTPQERSAEGIVVEAAPPRLLVWEGGVPDVLWGRHSFELQPDGEDTRVVNRESFSGSMAADVIASARQLLLAEFAAADEALRRAVVG